MRYALSSSEYVVILVAVTSAEHSFAEYGLGKQLFDYRSFC